MLTNQMLDQARRAQESLMTACVKITAPGDGWVWDPEQRKEVPAIGAVVYEGPGLVQDTSGSMLAEAGGQRLEVGTLVGKVPWHVSGLQTGMTLEATGCTDPDTPDRFTILSVEQNTLALTCRRFFLEAVEEVDRVRA